MDRPSEKNIKYKCIYLLESGHIAQFLASVIINFTQKNLFIKFNAALNIIIKNKNIYYLNPNKSVS